MPSNSPDGSTLSGVRGKVGYLFATTFMMGIIFVLLIWQKNAIQRRSGDA